MKKGFTLAEMVAAVVILSLVALIAFPPLLNFIRQTDNTLDDKTKDLVITSSTQYITRHSDSFTKTIGNEYYIYIEDLIKDDLLSNNLIKNSSLELKSCVKINVNNNYEYEYDLEIKCQKEVNNEN